MYKLIDACEDIMKYTLLFMILIVWAMQINAMDPGYGLDQNIPQSVSYIYYPAQQCLPFGHAGFAFGEYIDFELNQNTTSLKRAIEKTTKKNGYPFFQFTFDVTSDEFEKMGKIIRTLDYIFQDNCSVRASKPLIDGGICNIPFPVRISPMLTAAYLASGKQLRSNRVSEIKFYGNPSMIKNIATMAPGITLESLVMSSPILIGLAPYLLYERYNNYE